MADIKTVKIKKPGAPGNEGTAPAQAGGVTLPKYAQQGSTQAPQSSSGKAWTWVAIVATLSVILFGALVTFQSLELKHYSDPEPVWPPEGPR
jgi:hypothetical protein